MRPSTRWFSSLALLAVASCREPAPPPAPAAAGSAFDGQKAYVRLTQLCLIGPRNHGSDTKEEAERWIRNSLEASGAEVSVHEFRHVPKGSTGHAVFRNIVGRILPGEKRRILVGTHYDTRSWADRDPRPDRRMYPISGANDGGSGVAILLELASIWKKTPPPVGVDLIFFDGEDFGREGVMVDYFLGSRAWVREHPNYRVEWGVILDMVGDAALRLPREPDSVARAPAVVDRIWAAAARVGSKAFVDALGTKIHDDHTAFLDAGIPVALVIDFEYPFFHSDEDEPDKCSAESLGQVGRAILEAVSAAK